MNWLPVPALGGVNLFDDPRAIRDEEVQLARNLVPVRSGVIKKRGGLSRPFYTLATAGLDVPVAAVMSPLPQSVVDMVVYARISTGSIRKSYLVGVQFGNSEYVLTMPFDHPRVPLLTWNSKVYAIPGPYAGWVTGGPSVPSAPSQAQFYALDTTVDGTNGLAAPVVLAGTGNGNSYPKYAFPYKQRLVLANFGKGYENTIVFTDNYTADVVGNDVLASNTRSISLVSGADGDEIVAGIEVMLTSVGSPATSGLLILRRYGDPFLLTGDMDQTTGGTTTLDIKRISVKTGCAGQYTVARTPVGIIWAGADDVWCFSAGVLPHRIGQKIQPALRVTPASLQYRWTGVYHDGFYRLAVFGAGQDISVTAAPGDQWWLDLREGLPQDWHEARWWGPQQFLGGAAAGVAPTPQSWLMVPESRAGKDAKLFYVDRIVVPAGGIGFTVGEYGTDTRDLTTDPLTITDKDYVDPEITAELITKEYALSPGRDQINDGVMFSVRPSNDLTINADFVIDDGDQVISRTKRLGDTSSFQLDAAPLDATAPAFGPVTGKALKTALYPSTRRAGQTHRFRIYDTAGYTIAQGVNDSVAVGIDPGAGFYTYWVGTVAQGTYSIADLATAVAAAINAGKPAASNNWTLTPTAGIYTLGAGGPYGAGVSMTVRFSTFTVTAPDSGTAPTAAQALACRRLFGILGFDNTATNALNFGPAISPAIAGDTAPFKKGISDWEIYGIAANMEVLPRTP